MICLLVIPAFYSKKVSSRANFQINTPKFVLGPAYGAYQPMRARLICGRRHHLPLYYNSIISNRSRRRTSSVRSRRYRVYLVREHRDLRQGLVFYQESRNTRMAVCGILGDSPHRSILDICVLSCTFLDVPLRYQVTVVNQLQPSPHSSVELLKGLASSRAWSK